MTTDAFSDHEYDEAALLKQHFVRRHSLRPFTVTDAFTDAFTPDRWRWRADLGLTKGAIVPIDSMSMEVVAPRDELLAIPCARERFWGLAIAGPPVSRAKLET